MKGSFKDVGRSPSGRATRPTDQARSGLGDTASVPNAAGLHFCKDCAHFSTKGSPLVARCEHPKSYQGGDFDLVDGRDGRRFRACDDMRLNIADRCGRNAVLFAPRFTLTFAQEKAR